MKINGSLTIYDVKGLRTDLMDLLDDNGTFEVDVGDIIKCDAAGLQLLYSTGKTAVDMGGRLVVSGESEALRQVLQRTGVTLDMIMHQQDGQETKSGNS